MTIKQKQCLLAYLGYYVGAIDGKWGQLSEVACKAFQGDFGITETGTCNAETEKALKHAVAYGMPVKEQPKDFWAGIQHFKRSEFKCKCGKCGGFPVEPDKDLVVLLEKIRNHFGAAVTITSGVRCKTHNANVGGASSSQHLKGTAADIKVSGVKPSAVAAYAETLLPNSGGVGRYSTFTHVDVRANKSRWNG
jgi:peptidoglycan hydrolase-like protein with peptidoglycan-binding domain